MKSHPSQRGLVFPAHRKGYLYGFSLIELLTVIAVMSLLVVVSVPGITALASSGQVNQTVADIDELLDQARQYAVAQNTYVWVAFSPDTTMKGGEGLHMAVIASGDGTDPFNWTGGGTVPGATGTGNAPTSLNLLTPVRTFPQTKYVGAGTITDLSSLPNTVSVSSSNSPADSAISFNIALPGRTTTTAFTKVIEFTPSGQAHNRSDPIALLEFGFEPVKGATVMVKNATVIRINGLTGAAMVYR